MGTTGTHRDHGFFDGLEPADREALTARARRRSFAAGSTLMHEGQVGTEVLVLVSGRVKVTYLTREGRDPSPTRPVW